MPFTLQQALDPEARAGEVLAREGSVFGETSQFNPTELVNPLGFAAGRIGQTSDRALVNLLKRFPRLYNAAEAVPQEIRLLIGGLKDKLTGQRDIHPMFKSPSRMGAEGQLDMPAFAESLAERARLQRELPIDVVVNPTLVGEGAGRVNPFAQVGDAFGSTVHETTHGVLTARGVSEGTKAGLAKRLKDLLPEYAQAGLYGKGSVYTPDKVNEEIIARSLEAVALARQYPEHYPAETLSKLLQEVNRSVLPILEGRTPM